MKLSAPVLMHRNGQLELDFPGWDRSQMDSVRSSLICWSLKPKTTTLVAEFTLLALWEVKETFPQLSISSDDRNTIRMSSELRKGSNIGGPPLTHLKPIQREPTLKLWQRERALLTAAPGLGKTVMALTALAQRGFDLMVAVVPLTSLDGWEHEVRKWIAPDLPMLHILKWRRKEDVVTLPTQSDFPIVVLTTPETVGKITEMASEYGEGLDAVFYPAEHHGVDNVLILDESFLYQNRKSGRTNVIEELAYFFPVVWLLSGMPASTANDDLFTQLKILYPKTFRSYWKFARRYCLIEDNFWGSKVVGNKPDSEKKLRRDLADILIHCDYPEDIPNWIMEVVDCPMTEQQEALYLAAKDELKKKTAKEKPTKIIPKRKVLAITSDLRQLASNPVLLDGPNSSGKWDELLKQLRTKELPALVWVKYRLTSELLTKRIKAELPHCGVGVLTGSTKAEDRFRLVQQFQNRELDILLINDVVGKYSLTLTAAKAAYYLERDFNGETYYQSLFRARRIVSEHPVRIVLMNSVTRKGGQTIDRFVHEALEERSQSAQKLTIGRLIGSC